MPRLTVISMIEDDLGYCCPWFLFSRFRTRLVADRLGVTPRAVQMNKVSCGGCRGRANCLDKRITLKLKPRRVRDDT